MKLTVRCQGCGEDINIKKYPTRGDLQMHKGTEFPVNCQTCGKLFKVHVNDVRASVNNILLLIVICVDIVVTAGLFIFFGAISTLTSIIFLVIWGEEIRAVRSFNRFNVRRK